MAIPIVLGVIAGVCAVGGVGNGVHGGVKMKNAQATMKIAEEKQENAKKMCEKHSEQASSIMDELGIYEMKVLSEFSDFSDMIEKIQGRPEFSEQTVEGIEMPKFQPEEIKKISSAAALILGGLSGTAAGTAGGFAAAGATTSIVMAVGSASTGTSISALSGAAATNATLAALGGGSLAAGGGGMALGTAMLSGAAAGVAILVGGIIFNVTGCSLSKKTDEALIQAKEIEDNAKKICAYLSRLDECGKRFLNLFKSVNDVYLKYIEILNSLINVSKKTIWSEYSDDEKRIVKNTCLLVGILYKMCKVNLVIESKEENGINSVNEEVVECMEKEANVILNDVA